MDDIKKIIHIDMDAFYASVEQRDDPTLRGKPVIVGGLPQSRGVVATCSYEARKYGIHSAMPSKIAYTRCPYAIFIKPRFSVYQEVSKKIRDIFYRYTDKVEPLSLDEAYLDVTKNKKNIKYATEIAKMIKRDILEELGLTSSAGVSYNKFLAKVASDLKKPNGITVITPSSAQSFLDNLPINKFWGIGKVTGNSLKNMGIKNGYNLRQLSLYELEKIFKSRAYTFYQCVRGIDNREVDNNRIRKSVGSETTLRNNLNLKDELVSNILSDLSKEVSDRLLYCNKKGKTVTLKVKFVDFTQITRSISLDNPINSNKDIEIIIYNLLKSIYTMESEIRLLGVTISNLVDEKDDLINSTLFDLL